MTEFIGFDDCLKILIEYTDPSKPLNERIIAYVNTLDNNDVRITAELEFGGNNGDPVYYKVRGYSSFQTVPIPGGAYDGEYSFDRCPNGTDPVPGERVDVTLGEWSNPTGPFIYPINQTDNGYGYTLKDASNYYIGDFYNQSISFDYAATMTQICDGPYTFNGEEYYNTNYDVVYETFSYDKPPEWTYCDQFGNPLDNKKTIIKVFKKNGEVWEEKQRYEISGDKLPIQVGCEEGCEEDCIELYDATGTARICLCEAVYGDARDNVFPNLDLPEWKPFD